MKAVETYFLLQAVSADKLAEMVNAAIRENKQPFGYPFAVSNGSVANYCQAMAFYSQHPEDSI